MRSTRRSHDALGAAMLVGALAGFVIGALLGIKGEDFASPIVTPFVGAICGVVVAGLPFVVTATARHRRELRLMEAGHDEFRAKAHDGWIEEVDLTSEAPRPP
jgi:integral membrane sensor domain MASE1